MNEILAIQDLKVFRLERDPNFVSKWTALALVYSPVRSGKWYEGHAEAPADAVAVMLDNYARGRGKSPVTQTFARVERVAPVNEDLVELASKIRISL